MQTLPAVVVLAACLLAFIGGARAEGPQLPPAYPKPIAVGTTMVWQDADSGETKIGVVRFSDGLFHRWSWDDEETAEYLFCFNCADTKFLDFHAYQSFWPLEVGKSVTYWRIRGDPEAGRYYRDRISVIGTETLALPFGTVDTYVVLSEAYAVRFEQRYVLKSWYAPEIGLDIKYEFSTTDGQSLRGQVVAITTP